MSKPILLVIVLAVIVVAVVMFTGSSEAPSTTEESSEAMEENMMEKEDGDAMMEEGDRPVKEFSMNSFVEIVEGDEGTQYFPQFSLKEIAVNKGDLVKINVTVTAGTHTFKIDEYDIFGETPLNEEVTFEFVADKAGEFVYYCTIPGHRENGHWGTLTVLE